MIEWQIIEGDCRESLRSLPDGSVSTCVTSPPYFGLRDYGTGSWDGGNPDCDHVRGEMRRTVNLAQSAASTRGGAKKHASDIPYSDVCGKCGATRVDEQIGLEPTPEEFVEALVEVFREVRRVLRDDGTVWLNLGDSYAGAGYSNHSNTGGAQRDDGGKQAHLTGTGCKSKDLIGIPWMVAFALRADGWYLRQDIIWAKPNRMPESVQDRCTKAHEYIFLLSKSQRYYYDVDAIREPHSPDGRAQTKIVGDDTGTSAHENYSGRIGNERWPNGGRNKRSVWTVSTKPFAGAHFATFPPDLIEPCIRAGAPVALCMCCGEPWTRKVEKTEEVDETHKGSRFDDGKTGARDGGDRTQEGERFVKAVGDPEPSCGCNASPRRAVVLDPFAGAGTTGLVAVRNDRSFVGLELNPEYAELARDRIREDAPLMNYLLEAAS